MINIAYKQGFIENLQRNTVYRFIPLSKTSKTIHEINYISYNNFYQDYYSDNIIAN